MAGTLPWFLLTLPLALSPDPSGDGTGIAWTTSFEAACAAGVRDRRLLLVKPLGKRDAAAGNW